LRYAYLDESRAPTRPGASHSFLVIAVLSADQHVSRAIELHAKRLRKKIRAHLGEELKATKAKPEQVRRLLQAIATEDIAIVAVVIRHPAQLQSGASAEDWYREAVSLAALHCTYYWPQLHLILDKRYTKASLRAKLEEAIRSRLEAVASPQVTIEQLDSRSSLGLQVADYIAWAIARKYSVQDEQYYDLIKSKIVAEEVIEAK